MITEKKNYNVFRSLSAACYKLHLKEFAPHKILPLKIKGQASGDRIKEKATNSEEKGLTYFVSVGIIPMPEIQGKTKKSQYFFFIIIL